MTDKISQWQTSETLPDDGREVLMFSPSGGMAVWHTNIRWPQVTHWMPLPEGPDIEEAEAILAEREKGGAS